MNWFGFEVSTFLWVFIVLNVINVIIQTVKSIVTINGTKMVAAVVNAITFAFYTVVVIYMNADGLGIIWKAVIIGVANFFGVYVVKLIEEKSRKDRLWKVEATFLYKDRFLGNLQIWAKRNNISYNYQYLGKHLAVNFYAPTQKESLLIKDFVKKYDGKYFVTETKIL